MIPKEWSRQEQIDYTTEYIQKTFVDKGMCVDWSIHDKNDGNPHVHLLVTMRPFNPDHSWGNKEAKDWDFVRDTDGNIVVDESHPDWPFSLFRQFFERDRDYFYLYVDTVE